MRKIPDKKKYGQGKVSDLSDFIEELLKKYEVIAPVKKERKMLQFEKIDSKGDIDFENFPHAQLSFKHWLLPKDQLLMKYSIEKNKPIMDDKMEPVPKRVIFGLHACDIHSLKILDSVFLEEEDLDTAYKHMRDNTLIIGVGCKNFFKNCFCGSMNTATPPDDVYDLFFYLDGDKFYVSVGTDRDSLSKKLKSKNSSDADQKISELIKNYSSNQKLQMPDADLQKLVTDTYGTEFWTELGAKCFGCGGCTISCPTCFCFVTDDVAEGKGKQKMFRRVRNLDSCTLTNWALAAGGHNFQRTRGERLHRRFMHKFSQMKEKYGTIACIGCGRCVAICPTGAGNPVAVFSDLIKSNS